MLAKLESVSLIGTEARLVQVEVHVGNGLPAFRIVGLPAKSVTEAEQRVRGALESLPGGRWPPHRIVANLAPGTLRKEGTHFDIALALGILAADDRLPIESLEDWLLMGELALDGEVRRVPGILPAAIACRETGRKGLICPSGNATEAAIIDGVRVVPVRNLSQAVNFIAGTWEPEPTEKVEAESEPHFVEELQDVRGQSIAKRALEIAAAGGHNLLFMGPPGSGKTMLAWRMPSILPPMSLEESLEVTRTYSVAGLLPERASLIRQRPLRAPHHHVSVAGLIGGGAHLARPGEVSLAHHGVLFLDELTLFGRESLESLRAPLEDGAVRIARSAGTLRYPARFSLIAAINPCPCGYYGDDRKECRCSAYQIDVYRQRISGPLLDRFDLLMVVPRATKEELLGPPDGESSKTIRERVIAARELQTKRYDNPLLANASVDTRTIRKAARLGREEHELLGDAIDRYGLTGRGLTRLVRVSRTIADLEGSDAVTAQHIASALLYRFNGLKSEAD